MILLELAWQALQSVGHFLWGWATIDLIVGGVAVTIAVLEPPIVAAIIPDLRKWSICVAVVAFTCMGILAHGYHNGIQEKQRQWDNALAQEAINGEQARERAVVTVGPDSSDRSLYASDPNNRDSGKHASEQPSALRRLAPHSLFGR